MPFIIPNQTSTSLLRPTAIETPWVRPADWITITDTPNEVQFLMSDVVSPYTAIRTSFTQTGGVGNIYIDWGDGIIDTISTIGLTTTNHTYTSGGTPSVLGYNMWKIRVYGDAGTTITNCQILTNSTYYTQAQNPSGVLEAVFGDGTMGGGFQNNFGSVNVPIFPYLEYIKCPSVLLTGGFAAFNAAFSSCFGLRKIVLPTSAPNATSLTNMMANCYSLSEPVVFPQDALSITSLNNAFVNCASLRSVKLPPSLTAITDSQSCFSSCFSLTSIDLPPMPNNILMSSMFQNCYSLISFELKAFPTLISTTCFMDSMFNGCVSLEYIKLPSVAPPTLTFQMVSTFATCYSLKNCVLPDTMLMTGNGLLGTFTTCSSIASIVLPTNMSGATNLSNTFNSCYNLQSITLPSVVGATMSMNTTFANCRALSEIIIPSGWTITDLGSCFNGCGALERATLPPIANSLTNMASTFNGCSSLSSVVLPTSMNALTSLNSTFNSCIALKELTFPSSLPALTQIPNMCNNCRNLRKITMPTSAPVLTISNNVFGQCQSLKSFTFPTTTGNITTMLGMFANCISLNNINFSSTQLTSLATFNGLFSQTWNLSGATNVDKLGNPSTAASIYLDGGNNPQTNIPSLDFYCKFSVLNLSGQAAAPTRLSSLRLRNNGAGQYAGTSPQINISFTSMGQAALVQLFTDLPTITSKTINITSCPGAALLTPAERAIATGKGWTIIG
jgi:hypothetical protein